MDRPRVTIHNLSSADGRLDGFPTDVGLYYELAAEVPHQAVLTGSGTMLAAAASAGIDLAAEDPPPDGPQPREPGEPDGSRPWLVVVDSGARLTRFAWLRDQPHWRGVLVLCSRATPAGHLERLDRLRVAHLVAGAERVDLAAALTLLGTRYGVADVRVDAGGTLNGALLRAGLVDGVTVLIAPRLVGAAGSAPAYLADELPAAGIPLALDAVERRRDGHVLLRYRPRP